jgi:hypothetical protein
VFNTSKKLFGGNMRQPVHHLLTRLRNVLHIGF